MPRQDSFGFIHPVMTDGASVNGYIHIAECGQCQIDFPGLVDYAMSLVALLDEERRAKR